MAVQTRQRFTWHVRVFGLSQEGTWVLAESRECYTAFEALVEAVRLQSPSMRGLLERVDISLDRTTLHQGRVTNWMSAVVSQSGALPTHFRTEAGALGFKVPKRFREEMERAQQQLQAYLNGNAETLG